MNIVFRFASYDDRKAIYRWSNHPSAREVSFNTGEIDYAEHKRWLKEKIEDENTEILIFSNESSDIGQVRLERKKNEIVVSISMGIEFRGMGYGGRCLELSKEYSSKSWSGYPLVAYIRIGNDGSFKLFEKAGFKFVKMVQFNGYSCSELRLEKLT